MNEGFLKFKLADVERDSKEFFGAVAQLTGMSNGFFVSTGALLPGIVPDEDQVKPLLVIRSKRISEIWVEAGSDGPMFAIDGCDNDWHTSPYLVWAGMEVSIALRAHDIHDLLNKGRDCGEVLVAWLFDDSFILSSFEMHGDLDDAWHVASQSRDIPRYVPTGEYVESVHAEFPPLLDDNEERFIGQEGEPTYIAQCVEACA